MSLFILLFPMPRSRRYNIGCQSQSNVRRANSRINRADEQHKTDNGNSRIGMSALRARVTDNASNWLRIQRVRAH